MTSAAVCSIEPLGVLSVDMLHEGRDIEQSSVEEQPSAPIPAFGLGLPTLAVHAVRGLFELEARQLPEFLETDDQMVVVV